MYDRNVTLQRLVLKEWEEMCFGGDVADGQGGRIQEHPGSLPVRTFGEVLCPYGWQNKPISLQ